MLCECVGPARSRAPNGQRNTIGRASPFRQWCRAMTLMIWSNAQEMKSANWNSTTGRSPTSAAPAARPVKPDSSIGVSTTRLAPNSSRNPLVTLNAPPNWPTSSPMRKTSGFAVISARRAWETASRYVTWPSLVGGIDALLYVARVWQRVGQRLLAGIQRGLVRVFLDRLDPLLVEHAEFGQGGGELLDRISLGPFREHLPGDVGRRVVLGVAVHAHGHGLDQGGALARPGAGDRAHRGLVHGEDVDAVYLFPGHAVRDGLGRQVGRDAGQPQRRGVGPLVVLDDEDARQLQGGGDVQRLVEVAARGRSVAAVRQRHTVLTAVPERERRPGRHRVVVGDVTRRVIDIEVQPTVVQGAVPAARRPGGLAQEARDHLPRRGPPPQVGA